MEKARLNQTEIVSSILQEVADWLIEKGDKLWERDELNSERIKDQVERGMFWLAKIEDEFAGCLRYQLQDLEYWADVPHEDSAFVHRVAVRRKFAGKGLAGEMIEWAKQKAKSDGKKFLRLDCAKREKLCQLYEGFGFQFHSEKVREPYLVVRYEYELN